MAKKFDPRNLLLTARGKQWLEQFEPEDKETAERLMSHLTLVSHSEFQRSIQKLIETETGRRMAQTAAHLVDHVIPNVPVRQWVLSLPIPLRVLFAAHPHLLSPVLQVIQRAISTFLIKQAGFKRRDAQTGAITLIQRFGSAANLNIHLHCLVLDGVYHIQGGVPAFHGVRTPTAEQLQTLLDQIIQRIMKALTRHGALIEEEGIHKGSGTE